MHAPRIERNRIVDFVKPWAGLRIGDNQTLPIDATCHYWGSERGPSGVGPGDGDAIIVQPGAPAPAFLPFATVPTGRLPEWSEPRC